MKKSKKTSARVTAPNQEASAAAAEAKTASRRKAARSSAVENVARRQFEKTQAAATQGHSAGAGATTAGEAGRSVTERLPRGARTRRRAHTTGGRNEHPQRSTRSPTTPAATLERARMSAEDEAPGRAGAGGHECKRPHVLRGYPGARPTVLFLCHVRQDAGDPGVSPPIGSRRIGRRRPSPRSVRRVTARTPGWCSTPAGARSHKGYLRYWRPSVFIVTVVSVAADWVRHEHASCRGDGRLCGIPGRPPLEGRPRSVATVLFSLIMSLNGFVFGVISVQLVPLARDGGLGDGGRRLGCLESLTACGRSRSDEASGRRASSIPKEIPGLGIPAPHLPELG